MGMRWLWMLFVLAVALAATGCGGEHATAENYEDHVLEPPYGSVVEDRDYTEEVDAIRNAGEKAAGAALDAADRLSGYVDTAGVLDAADDVSDSIRSGAKKVSSLAGRVTDFISTSLP